MMTLTDLLGNDDQPWMEHPGRPCALPKNDPPKDQGAKADGWFPGERYEKSATQLCQGCPVQVQCLTYALENDEEFGIFGGLTPGQRRTLVRKQERKSA